MTPDGTPDAGDIIKAAGATPKILDALGKLFPGIKSRSIAKAESKETDRMLDDLQKIKDAQKSLGLSDESIAEIMRNTVQRHSRNVNFDAVLEFAEPMIDSDSDPSKVDQNWAEHFRDHAEKATDDEIRRTWAAILAGEINKPGSFSKRTLSILSDMEKAEAESFMKLCSYSTGLIASTGEKHVIAGELIPILSMDERGTSFNGGKIRLKELSALDSLGLIDTSLLNVNTIPKGISFSYLANNALVIAKNNTEEKKISFEGAVFQSTGLELSRICDIGSAPDLAGILSSILEKNGLEVTIAPFPTSDIRMP